MTKKFYILVAVSLLGPLFAVLLGAMPSDDFSFAELLGIRWPRVAFAWCVGAALALSGALLQTLLRNPLADPYLLGVSGGAALTSTLALAFGISLFWLPWAASVGAAVSVAIVYIFAARISGEFTHNLLLLGTLFAFFAYAAVGLVVSLAPNAEILRSLWFWWLGDLAVYEFPTTLAIALAIAFVFLYPLHLTLDRLSLGEMAAQTWGVSTSLLYRLLFVFTSILTALVVCQAGSIGFVGLMVPQAVRLWVSASHRLLLPASVLLGGSLLSFADALSRTLFNPQMVPIGIMTALVGVPLTFVFLRKQR